MEYLRGKSAKGLEQLSHHTAQDNITQHHTLLLISAEGNSLESALLWRSAISICQFYIDNAHLLQPTAAMFMVASIWCTRMEKTLFTVISWPIHTFLAYVPYDELSFAMIYPLKKIILELLKYVVVTSTSFVLEIIV